MTKNRNFLQMETYPLIALLMAIIRPAETQVFSWDIQEPLQVTVCSGDTSFALDWIYTPASTVPLSIDWVKLQSDGVSLDKAIGSYAGGTFTPDSNYNGRVSKSGSTAEIVIQNPTAADGGFYKVTVFDSSGTPLDGGANVTFTVPASVGTSGVTATCSANVATCGNVADYGTPSSELTISYGTFSESTSTDPTISTTLTSEETVNCVLTGLAAQCLNKTGIRVSHSVTCGLDCSPCENAGLAFVIICPVILVVGLLVLILVGKRCVCQDNDKGERFQLLCLIVSGLWIGIGVIGLIVTLVICSQVKPPEVLPCGGTPIGSVVVSTLTAVAGIVLLILRFTLFGSDDKTSPGGPGSPGNGPDQPLNTVKPNKEDPTSRPQ